MCGHFGYITSKPKTGTKARKDFFRDMLVFDTPRGIDSTGIYLHENKDKSVLYKRALAGYDFARMGNVSRMISMIDPRVAMGHNRAATKGTVNDENAHPFVDDGVVMTHNGTLTNFWSLKAHSAEFDVDSALICNRISTGKFFNFCKEAEGAFALAWYDTKEDKFYLFNNGKRSLCFAISEDGDTMYYGSEGDMMSLAAYRNDNKFKGDEWIIVEEGMLFTFEPDKPSEYTSEEIELKKPQPVGGSGRRSYNNNNSPKIIDYTKKPTFREVLTKMGLKRGDELQLEWNNSHSEYGRHTHEFTVLNKEEVYSKHHSVKVIYICKDEEELYSLLAHADNILIGEVDAALEVAGQSSAYLYVTNIKETELELPNKEGDTKPKRKNKAHDYYPANGGVYIPKKVFLEKIKDGCSQCREPLDIGDATIMEWLDESSPLCPGCSSAYRGQHLN